MAKTEVGWDPAMRTLNDLWADFVEDAGMTIPWPIRTLVMDSRVELTGRVESP